MRSALIVPASTSVSFNYLGHVGAAQVGEGEQEGAFRLADEPVGPARGGANRRSHPLALDGVITGGRLELAFSYNRRLHRRETVEALAAAFRDELAALLAEDPAAAATAGEDGDFADFGWSPEDVDAFRDAIGDALGA